MIFLFTPFPLLFVQFQREKLNFVKPFFSWELAPLSVIVDHARKIFYFAYLLKNRPYIGLGTIQVLRNQKGGWVRQNAYVFLQGGWVGMANCLHNNKDHWKKDFLKKTF